MSEASLPFPRPEAPSALWRLCTDEQLARRAAEGDERAFAEIFRRYSNSLYRFCLAMTGSPHDAQEALQNAMVKALRALPGEERRIKLKPWLYKVTRNEAIEIMRRRRANEELDPEQLADIGVAETAEARERLRILLADLELLPERQRAVLLMRELSGLEFAEIAAAYETSAAAARQTLYEARLGLRALEEGRERRCADVRRELSDGSARASRRLGIHSHLRNCPGCRAFGDAIAERRRDLAALAPLPVGTALGLLRSLVGGSASGGGPGGGVLAGTLAPAAQTLAVPAVVKSAAAVALVVASVSAADRSGIVHLPGLGGTGAAKPAGAVSLPPRATRPQSTSNAGEATQARPPSGAAPSIATPASTPSATPIAGATQGPSYGQGAPDGVAVTTPGGAANDAGQAEAGQSPFSGSPDGSAAEQPGRTREPPEASENGARAAEEHQAGHAPAAPGPPPSGGNPENGPPPREGTPAPPGPPSHPGGGPPESGPPGRTGAPPPGSPPPSPPGAGDPARGGGAAKAAGPG
jgi:RNA polymerase sigma factor (sigma-70 family)